ncbi:hypothetical protein SEA_KLEVEY_72 [Arthrobacter phage Klevey]|uniref:Uncharacterized protein n=1 Tax=Arthrobacter phage Klevey TaxID=2867481 RepID=A0AAE9BS73_9CAUD|nr:hypothetical protein SEA_KLEVEY_72 [Arthrobacter phage Klevey]
MSGVFLKTVLKWAIASPAVPRAALEDALIAIVEELPDHEIGVGITIESEAVAEAITKAILSHPVGRRTGEIS